jgi:hypothetical protein
MKRELSPAAVGAVLLLAVLLVGWYLWKKTDAPGNDVGEARAQFALTEEWARKNHYDLRKDPLLAPQYYKFHPDEKPPAGGLPKPVGQPLPTGASAQATPGR